MMHQRILLIGYGNPVREDDGLGPALAEAVEQLSIPGVATESALQLAVEDALSICRYEVVIFADAAEQGEEPFAFSEIVSEEDPDLGSHASNPGAVLWLAHACFGVRVRGFALAIRGYSFSMFSETMTDKAKENLDAAVAFIVPLLRRGIAAESLESAIMPEASYPIQSSRSVP